LGLGEIEKKALNAIKLKTSKSVDQKQRRKERKENTHLDGSPKEGVLQKTGGEEKDSELPQKGFRSALEGFIGEIVSRRWFLPPPEMRWIDST